MGLVASIYAHGQEFPADLGTNPKYDEHRDQPTIYHHLADPSFRMAVGVEFTYPVYTLSFKYAVTEASVLQALVSPIMATYGHYDYAFYGARYIYRFPAYAPHFYGPTTVSYPYLFAGAGILSYNLPVYDALGAYDHNTSNSLFAYSLGLGYEWIMGNHFGVALEAGYGSMTANGTSGATTFTYTGALHYYFQSHGHHRVRAAETEEEGAGEEMEGAEHADQPEEDKPAPRGRRHHARSADETEE